MKLKSTSLLILAVFSLTGCVGTFKEIKPLNVGTPPSTRPATLILDKFEVRDQRLSEPEQTIISHAFEVGIEKWCVDSRAFGVLRPPLDTTVSTNAIRLSGVISEVEKGSAAERFWVGMGAGQARIQGDFEVQAVDGTKLASFHARKLYLGGVGIGGWDMMQMEDLAGEL